MAAAVQLIRSSEALATLVSPQRLRILEELAEPDSASGLARRLGVPRQKVNYHLRELEREHFIELVEERRKGNCIERVMRAAARSYIISPEALGKLGSTPAEQQDRFSAAYLAQAAGRIVEDLGTLTAEAQRTNKRMATMAVETEVRFASPAERNAFAEELTQELARLVKKYHTGGKGRLFRFVLGGLPAVSRRDPSSNHPVSIS